MGLFKDTTTTCAGKMRRISVFSAAYQYKVCVCLQSDFKMAGLPGLFLNWKFSRFRWNEKGKKRKLNVNGSKKTLKLMILGYSYTGWRHFPWSRAWQKVDRWTQWYIFLFQQISAVFILSMFIFSIHWSIFWRELCTKGK